MLACYKVNDLLKPVTGIRVIQFPHLLPHTLSRTPGTLFLSQPPDILLCQLCVSHVLLAIVFLDLGNLFRGHLRHNRCRSGTIPFPELRCVLLPGYLILIHLVLSRDVCVVRYLFLNSLPHISLLLGRGQIRDGILQCHRVNVYLVG